ncbi:MAG: bifunctional demethylmenaquinone methyltransferase/2-methoxy-6-polyprenyl-1,4-benzoquinol methylase UbiE [Proteobacteria bacterium]|nr:bifunctional demethylmenaquinone methyltransferase/2-methoxy-6-polyprenyl-1,4-benzoquinol methylase UbiE [Pseudomonadota bacterium]
MENAKKGNPEREWFGARRVGADEKTRLVRGVFDSVADKYDLMNDLMSGGLHRLWKDRFVRMIRPRPEWHYLDVAGGTGDIAFRIKKAAGPKSPIAVFDLNPEMLRVGRTRAIDRGWVDGFDWIQGNAESLPFADDAFDVYTIAFGLRNVTHIDTALAEAHRVLKPGGRFFCLEFSRVDEPFLAKIYDAWSFRAIPHIGHVIAKDRDSYQYLVESIKKFPPQAELARRMGLAGFKNCRFTNLSFGAVAIHQGLKT